jgi:8-amino-7-oxononanoate synthase
MPHVRRRQCGTLMLEVPQQIPQSPIFALLTPEPRSLAKWCQDAGFVVRPIVPPTVPEGKQRVRVCLHAGNSFEDVQRLVERIKQWLGHINALEVEGSQRPGFVKAAL